MEFTHPEADKIVEGIIAHFAATNVQHKLLKDPFCHAELDTILETYEAKESNALISGSQKT